MKENYYKYIYNYYNNKRSFKLIKCNKYLLNTDNRL